jgi:nucleoside 2-deoxyribosyltransferase
MSQVFISYSGKDRAFVNRLATDLGAHLPDAQVFYDMLIQPGTSWAQTLAARIEQADIVLAVLSPDYLASAWASQELNVAIERHLNQQSRLLPLLIRPCNPTGFLSNLTWVDFTEDYEAGLARLIWGITGERPKSAKGDKPGVLTRAIDPREVESLLREVRAAVELFKSRAAEAIPFQQTTEHDELQPQEKIQCFVIMPFGDHDLQVVYEDFVKPTLVDGCNLHVERGDDVFGSNVIMDDILKSIGAADVILADLTRKNANVFYEVGICHALGKPVLLIAQSIDDVPFDLRHRRVLLYDYTPRGCKRLEGIVRQNMNEVLKSSRLENPI